MCAILGFAGHAKRGQWRLVHHLLTELFVASAVRGGDASGFAAIHSGKKGKRLVTDKRAVPSTFFAATSFEWGSLRGPSCVIAHCRAATHGSPHTPGNINNHPFVSDDEKLAAVVNGISSNYLDVADEYGLGLRADCDSEVILRLVEANQHPAVGLDMCLRELKGGMAAAVLDVEREVVWLAHNESRPLWLLRLDGINGCFFCSTETIALIALRRVFGREAQSMLQVLVPVVTQRVTGLSSQGHWVAPLDVSPPEKKSASTLRLAGNDSPARPKRRGKR